MNAVLGISALYHDSAAVLLVDGQIVAAAQEERFSRLKHDDAFPTQAVAYCLEHAGITPADLDFVAYYEKPLLRFERLLETYFAEAPRGFKSFSRAIPLWLRHKVHLARQLANALPGYERKFVYVQHHESHAASAFFASPFDEAAIMTTDGVGEWATATFGTGRGHHLHLVAEQRFPHSLGLFYSAMTTFAGFRVNSGEYKLMGLAPYGTPRFVDALLQGPIRIRQDGSVWLDQRYYAYARGLTMTSPRMESVLEGPPHPQGSTPSQREMDIAASAQAIVETALLRAAQHVHDATGQTNLCMAGGVALNCVAHGRLVREGPFERIWVQPAAGDAGGALGAALFVWHQLLEKPRRAQGPAPSSRATSNPTAHNKDAMKGALLGPDFTPDECKQAIQSQGLSAHHLPNLDERTERVAELLDQGRVVGWFEGRMEFGPRALGCRSILADPRGAEVQKNLNLKIKFRESFRPFAPLVLAEHAHEWFDVPPGFESPYMLFVAPVAEHRRTPSAPSATNHPTGLQRVHQIRSTIPAVTHVDFSARLQTLTADAPQHALRRLLEAFHQRTGCPILVNTSFNVRGEPIVCTPDDAIDGFLATDMDALVLGEFLLLKEEMPPQALAERAHHVARFEER